MHLIVHKGTQIRLRLLGGMAPMGRLPMRCVREDAPDSVLLLTKLLTLGEHQSFSESIICLIGMHRRELSASTGDRHHQHGFSTDGDWLARC